jgi:hypothetical protein
MLFRMGAWKFIHMQIKTKCLGIPDYNGCNRTFVKSLDLIPQAVILLKIQWGPLIKISDPKTLLLKSIKNKPFIIINLSVIVIKLQIIRVHIYPFRTLRRHL